MSYESVNYNTNNDIIIYRQSSPDIMYFGGSYNSSLSVSMSNTTGSFIGSFIGSFTGSFTGSFCICNVNLIDASAVSLPSVAV